MKTILVHGVREEFEVSRIAFGTGSALKGLEKEQFFALFDLFEAHGGTVIDTAPGYCGGKSEQYIGEWMQRKDNRKRIHISTKACHAFPGEPSRLTEKDMLEDLSLSLRQLQTDYIDVLWLHNDDPSVPVQQIMDAVQAVVETGKVRAIGCSNWATDRIEQANGYAQRSGQTCFFANQIQMSLAQPSDAYRERYNVRSMDEESYRWYLEQGLSVFAFSAMAQGFFSIAASQGIAALPPETASYFSSIKNLIRLRRVQEYMEKHHVSATVPVLGYVMGNRLPAVAIMSTTKTGNLEEIMRAAEADFTEEDADALFRVTEKEEMP